jgi:hypothetical protein
MGLESVIAGWLHCNWSLGSSASFEKEVPVRMISFRSNRQQMD